MSQMPGSSTAAPRDFREDFDEELDDQDLWMNCNAVTYFLVKGVHKGLRARGVPMTRAHRDAAVASLRNGDTICVFMGKENRHVMASTGNGLLYNMGKGVHTVLSWYRGEDDAS
jgi:hypothetical protein